MEKPLGAWAVHADDRADRGPPCCFEAVLTALLRVDEPSSAAPGWRCADELRVAGPARRGGRCAGALLIAFAAQVMGLCRLAVFVAPLLLTQVSFRRYAGIRPTYLQTVPSLSRVTEVGGYIETGHSDGSASWRGRVGRELGVDKPSWSSSSTPR